MNDRDDELTIAHGESEDIDIPTKRNAAETEVDVEFDAYVVHCRSVVAS